MTLPIDETEPGDFSIVEHQAESIEPIGSGETLENVEFLVPEEHEGKRVDLFLTLMLDGYSRVFLRRIIADDQVFVDDRPVKPAFKVFQGQRIRIGTLPPPPTDGPIPEKIPLNVLFEDEYLAVINKPPGMVVHPAKGHWSGTLTAALAHHFQQLSDAGGVTRPGIVHRLDRDTSGVIAIAKTNEVHFKLSAQFEAREVTKTYMALVLGKLDRDRDWINQPIGHHPYQREKMAIRSGHESSRDASTYFEVVERFTGYALLNVLPKTGRTHQIRLHLAHIGCPILCDRLYGGHAQVTRGQLLRRHATGLPPKPGDEIVELERQALHAHKLEFTHPKTGQKLQFVAPVPDDFERVLNVLRNA
jgi:23S rRNA pseudouridine1911/1915/1917 synthase